jgi:uncharacterized protein
MGDMSSNDATRQLLAELDANQDGYSELTEKGHKAILKVFNPKGQGRPVDPIDLTLRAKLLKITPNPAVAIEHIIRETAAGRMEEGAAHSIGNWPAQVERKNAAMEVEVSANAMECWVVLEPPQGGGEHLRRDQILETLKRHDITAGLLENIIDDLTLNPVYKKPIQVATGKPATRGAQGYVKILFESFTKPQPIGSKKSIDFKNVNVIHAVQPGEAIAEKVAPTRGEPGFNVKGMILPAENGAEAEFKIGANVEIAADGKTAVAKLQGRPIVDSHGYLRVDEVIRLKNVDYSTGNVDFPGSIVVEETIADGFRLKAAGSIILNHSVGVAQLISHKDVILAAGFMGRGQGKITAEGDVYARFVEHGTIEAGGSIYISDAALNSKLIAGGSIIVKGHRCDIIGGEIIAGKSVQCQRLGGAGEARTVVTVGTSHELVTHIKDLKLSISQKEATVDKIRVSLNRLNDIMMKRRLDEQEAEMHAKLLVALDRFRNLLDTEITHLKIANEAVSVHEHAFVSVEDQIFPNCEIFFGHGVVYRSPIEPVEGRKIFYVGEDRTLITATNIPKFMEVTPEQPLSK